MSAPLKHLKILDFSTLLPGPYATMMLADLGAEVLRIEAPGRPELTRMLPPFDDDGTAAGHAYLNRNKRTLGLNLKGEGAVDIVRQLVSDAGYDIIVEQSRPGVMTRLGVGYEAVRAWCPNVIYCSLTGYGQSGPLRDRAGHDLNYLALSGMLAHYGREQGGPPPPLPTQVADIGGGSLHLVIGLLAAVIRRTTTGEGGHVDISMHDGALAWNGLAAADAIVGKQDPQPESMGLNGGTYYDLYETSDGRLLSVGSLEPKFWTAFCTAIKRDDLLKPGLDWSTANQRQLKPILVEVLKGKTLAAWHAIFEQVDACVEPVLGTTEALDHPHTRAREMVVEVPQPNGTAQLQIGSPIKMSGHRPAYRFIGSTLGAHSRDLLRELGYGDDDVDRLIATGVVAE